MTTNPIDNEIKKLKDALSKIEAPTTRKRRNPTRDRGLQGIFSPLGRGYDMRPRKSS